MRKAKIAGFGLALATIMALFMFAPGESDSITDGASFFGIHIAQATSALSTEIFILTVNIMVL